MSKLDNTRRDRYQVPIEEAIQVSDVLAKLETELAREEEAIKRSQAAAQHLRIAVAAIKRDMQASEEVVQSQKKVTKRGILARSILDCLREGIGTVAALKKGLERKGLQSSAGSISNAIQRLQEKKLIHFDHSVGLWRIRETAPSTSDEAVNGPGVSAPDFGG